MYSFVPDLEETDILGSEADYIKIEQHLTPWLGDQIGGRVREMFEKARGKRHGQSFCLALYGTA